MRLAFRTFLLLVLLLAVPSAFADTLFSQPGASPSVNAWSFGPANSGLVLAAPFTLSGDSTVTGMTLRYWLVPGQSPVNMNWIVYGNNSGDPGTTLFNGTSPISSSVVTLTGPFGYEIYDGGINFSSPFHLAAGTYWLGLNPADVNSMYWDQASSGAGGKCWDGSSAICYIPATTFTIEGTQVPEPASLVLVASGALALMRRRRKMQ